MHLVLVNRLEGLSLPRNSVVRLTYRPDMNIAVYVVVKQQHNNKSNNKLGPALELQINKCPVEDVQRKIE